MPNSVFGYCSLRTSVSCIYIFNVFWITYLMMFDFMHRLSNFSLHTKTPDYALHTKSTGQEYNENLLQSRNYSTYNNSLNNHFKGSTPFFNMFLDYVYLLKLAWCIMEYYLNIHLKKSTYKISPEKIYAWLVIYYANLSEAIIFEIIHITKRPSSLFNIPGLVSIILFGTEIYIIHLYYSEQKLRTVNSFPHIKWKYITKPEVQLNTAKTTGTVSLKKITSDRTIDESSSDYTPIFVRKMRNSNVDYTDE